ncbi:hypothetical protein FNV43_RR22323 [Rhamnella rubrinervis]|uniref:MADS-box domain-containing protein n=1 Tax=Rhamnella rubrinervis TaxID=2594499 RepID=A0A8K0GRY8_9ROSA|nr:hypothetical protein FNV43_RR22323 [Rhamnella rubrinervis]
MERGRKKGLMKKASDLSILCDVKICMIIYDSDNNEPEIWPNNAADEVKTLIHNYKLARENCGSRRSKKRALDLTDINVKDKNNNNTSEANNNKKRKSAAGSASSPSSVADHWHGLNIDGLSKDQMLDLLSNLDRKIGGLQKRIDDRVAKKPYQCSAATPPLHTLDSLASSSSSDEYSFQTTATATATYPPWYFRNMMVHYFQNMTIQSFLEDQMMMSANSSCQSSSFLADHHQLPGDCCWSDQLIL